jgi:hypothetical protein
MGIIYGHERSNWLQKSAPACEAMGFSRQDVLDMPPWEFYALDWLLQNLGYRQIALSRPNVLTVVYEELCLNPVVVARQVFAFLGWDVSAQTSRFIEARTNSRLRTLFMRFWRGKRFYYDLYREPSDASMGWKHSLTGEQQEGILRIASRFTEMGWWSGPPEAKAEANGVVNPEGRVEAVQV